MPTFNVRLAAIILVIMAVLFGGLHLLHGIQVHRQSEILKVASERAEEEKNLADAIRFLQDYTFLAPQDLKARLHLGLLYAEALSPRPAFDLLNEVLRLADSSFTREELREARRKLVDMSLMLRQFSHAEKDLNILLEETPDDPELLDLLGQVQIWANKDEEACKKFERAIQIAPSQVNSYLRLANVLRVRLRRKADADAVVEGMIRHPANVKSAAAYEKYAYYYLEQEKFDPALMAAEKILELVPDDPRGLWLVGRCSLAKRDYEKAEDFLERGRKAAKEDRAMYRVLADVKVRMNKRQEAIRLLKEGVEATRKSPSYLEVVWDLVNLLVAESRFDEARAYINEMKEKSYPAVLIDFIEARIAVMQKDWKTAKKILESIAPDLNEAPGTQRLAFLFLSQCYHEEGNVEKQIIALKQALKIDPYLLAARASLAEIYKSRGKLEDAAEEYRKLTTAPHPESAAYLNLARTHIMLRLREDKEKRDWEPVDRLLEQIQGKRPLNPEIAVLKAEVLLAKGQADETEKLLRECTKRAPKNVEIRLALINLAMYQANQETDPVKKEEKWQQARRDIDDAEQNLGDRSGLAIRMARGSYAVRHKDPQMIDALKKLGGDLDAKWSEPERQQLWGGLAILSVQAGDLELARAYCRKVAEQQKNQVHIRYLLCELNLRAYEKGQSPDLAEVEQMVGEIERLSGRSPFWLYCKAIQALLLSKNKDPQLLLEARGHLQDAMAVRSDWFSLATLAGKICELQEEPDQALEYYIRAIYIGERDNEVLRRTVQLLVPRHRVDEAKKLFDFLEKQKSPLLGEMQQDYVYVKVFTGPIAEAQAEVDKTVAADCKNYKDFVWQGTMYGCLTLRLKAEAQREQARRESQRLEARDWRKDPAMLQMAQRAVNAWERAQQLNPQADDIWLGFVQLLVEMGRPDLARPLIRRAEVAMKKSEMTRITLGRCYEMVDDREKAQEQYEAAAKAAPENCRVLRQQAWFYLRANKPALADPVLRKIVALQSATTLTDVCWARRQLAIVLGRSGEFDQLCAAMALVEENLRSRAASIDDKRLRVQLLISDPRKEKVDEAIHAMEDLVKSTDATPEDNFRLAQHYLRKGNWLAYEDAMRSVLGAARGGVQPKHLVAHIDALLEKKDLDEARNWLQTLEKFAPNALETVRLKAESLFRSGNYTEAFNVSVAFLDNPAALPRDRGQQLQGVAGLMERFAARLKAEGKHTAAGPFDEKADLYFSSMRSKRVCEYGDAVYSAYLARQKRIRESLEVLEQTWEKADPELVRVPAYGIVTSRAATPAQMAQLEKILEAAAKKSNRPVNLLLTLGSLYDEQHKYDKAGEVYREVLGKEPRNYQALNNLSVDLARSGRNLDESLKLVNDALAVCGPLAGVLDSRALVHIARQDPDKALADLALAIKDDGAPEQYFHQAWAYLLAGRREEATAAFAEAVKKGLDPKKLDPGEVAIYDRLKDNS